MTPAEKAAEWARITREQPELARQVANAGLRATLRLLREDAIRSEQPVSIAPPVALARKAAS